VQLQGYLQHVSSTYVAIFRELQTRKQPQVKKRLLNERTSAYARDAQISAPDHRGDYIFCGGARSIFVSCQFGTEIFHISGAFNFKVTLGFLEGLCLTDLDTD
jgi:hypothetical protein